MSDGFTVEVDGEAVKDALARLGDVALTYTKPASKVTAESIQAEMQSRVARATGQTAAGVTVTEVEDGYVVHTSDVDPVSGSYRPGLHVGLWIEKGTRRGKPGSHASPSRPWFFVSAQLEEGAHERRIAEALQAAGEDVGLGS